MYSYSLDSRPLDLLGMSCASYTRALLLLLVRRYFDDCYISLPIYRTLAPTPSLPLLFSRNTSYSKQKSYLEATVQLG
jgi:hypothetical protein